MIFSLKRPSTDSLRAIRRRRREASILRSLPDHIRRDLGLPDCGRDDRALALHRLNWIGW